MKTEELIKKSIEAMDALTFQRATIFASLAESASRLEIATAIREHAAKMKTPKKRWWSN